MFTGRQALELKLIDELGDEQTAIAWLAKEKGIDAKTPVRDWQLKPRFSDLAVPAPRVPCTARRGRPERACAERFEEWGALQAVERLNLDGLLALWHPPSTN